MTPATITEALEAVPAAALHALRRVAGLLAEDASEHRCVYEAALCSAASKVLGFEVKHEHVHILVDILSGGSQ